MRLKVLVKRHNLPDSPIVWAIENDPTISQILEQINEILPLESGSDWGLEDYAFELRDASASNKGFECLHFQQASQILKDGDEVVIRPLLSQDVKQRRMSGRHQLSSDGRHLYDGIPFGRPKLRAPINRPAIDIPPRKRRRIAYNEDSTKASDAVSGVIDESAQLAITSTEDNLFVDNGKQLVVHADFIDADEEDESDSEDDEDYVSADGVSEDMEDSLSDIENELNGLQEEAEECAQSSDAENHPEGSDGDMGGYVLRERVGILREAFPKAPKSVCQMVLQQSAGDLGTAWETLNRGFPPALTKSFIMASKLSRRKSTTSPDKRRPALCPIEDPSAAPEVAMTEQEKQGSDEEVLDPEDEDMLRYYDQNGLAPGSIGRGHLTDKPKIVFSDESDLEMPFRTTLTKIGVETSAVNQEDSDTESVTSDDTSSSDGDPSSDSDDSSEPSGNEISHMNATESSDSDTSSDDDQETLNSTPSSESSSGTSSSESDSEPEESSSKLPHKVTPVCKNKMVHTKTRTVAPGSGKKSTQARNDRRRKGNALTRFQQRGILPAGTTLTEFKQINLDEIDCLEDAEKALSSIRSAPAESKKQSKTAKAASESAEFEARRQQLLQSLASGGVDISQHLTPSKATAISPDTEDVNMTDAANTASAGAQANSHGVNTHASTSPTAVAVDSPATDSAETSGHRRAKLDLGAGRRMLFGALGIKTPRNKADEEKVKNDLMKYVRPVKRVSASEEAPCEIEQGQDPEAWREKITLRGVECCHEGIEYTEPPFPFTQRWDPQQQGWHSYGKRRGKGKKGKRNQTQFYDDQPQSKKRKTNDGTSTNFASEGNNGDDCEAYVEENPWQDATAGYDYTNDWDTSAAIEQQLQRDGNEVVAEDEDDLPIIPEDISTLPDLVSNDLKPGAVVAFKQLILSEATKWQPQMSEYRTAVITQVLPGDELEMSLAKRDREVQVRHYDEETGQRLYGKFASFDDDDDDDDDNDGFIAAFFSELVEPKMVQIAPPILATDLNQSTDESATLDHEAANAQESLEVSPEAQVEKDVVVEGMDRSEMIEARHREILADHSEDLAMEVSDESRQDIIDQMIGAGFRSSVPPSVTKLHQFQNTVRESLLPSSNSCDTPIPGSPCGAVWETSTNTKPFGDHFQVGNSHIGDAQCSDSIPPLPNISQTQSHSHVTDCGHQPELVYEFIDGSVPGNQIDPMLSSTEQPLPTFNPQSNIGPDTSGSPVKSFVQGDSTNPTKEPAQRSGSPSSDSAAFPDLDDVFEIYSTARSSMLQLPVKQEAMLPVQSSADKFATESYDAAMAKLDAQVDGVNDADTFDVIGNFPDENMLQPSFAAENTAVGFESPSYDSQITPMGSQHMPYILSSSDEADAGAPIPPITVSRKKKRIGKGDSTESPRSSSGLVTGSKKRIVKISQTISQSDSQSQSQSQSQQRRSTRRSSRKG